MKQTKQRATVLGRSGKRFGKGFSREELQKAGSNLKHVVKLGAPVDSKRRTAHEENIEIIKALLKEGKESKDSKGKD
jgi:ribosomal protein L13E